MEKSFLFFVPLFGQNAFSVAAEDCFRVFELDAENNSCKSAIDIYQLQN